MRKFSVGIVLLIGVMLITIVGFVVLQKPRFSSSQTGSMDIAKPEQREILKQTSTDLSVTQNGRYISYSSDVLTNIESRRRVLFFFANWCPTCKPVDESFSQNGDQIPADVTIVRVNYNDSETDQAEKDLARKYAITYQHSFVQIDEQGNEVTKWNGGSIAELLKNIQ